MTETTATTSPVWEFGVNRSRKQCTLGLHPDPKKQPSLVGFIRGQCDCYDYRATQCCTALTPCRMHGCGVRKGCKCPLPATGGAV